MLQFASMNFKALDLKLEALMNIFIFEVMTWYEKAGWNNRVNGFFSIINLFFKLLLEL